MTWRYADIEAEIDRHIGPTSGDDPKVKKRVRILDAARERFLAQGYRKTSVAEIARDAGVAKGTVYLYFETKAQLLVAVIAAEEKASLAALRPAFDSGLPPGEALRRFIEGTFSMVHSMPITLRLWSDAGEAAVVMDELPPELLERGKLIGLELFTELMEDAVGAKLAPKDARVYGTVLNALGGFASMLGRPEVRGELSVKQFASVFADLIVSGLKVTLGQTKLEKSA